MTTYRVFVWTLRMQNPFIDIFHKKKNKKIVELR